MSKLTFDEALQYLAEERPLNSEEVQARALNRKVWIAAWGLPGCLYESFSVLSRKADAIEVALDYMERSAQEAQERPSFLKGFSSTRPACMGG